MIAAAVRALPGRAGYRRSKFFAGSGLVPRVALPSRSGSIAHGQEQRERRHARRSALQAATALLPSVGAFDATTVLVMPFYLAMIVFPKKPLTQKMLGVGPMFAAGAALYGLLLAAWNPLPQLAAVVWGPAAAVQAVAAGGGVGMLRAALPSMPAFAALFSTPEVTVIAWAHLVLLDLLQARWVYQDGLRNNVPTWHSAILCFMAAPLGLLCHLATKALVLGWRGHGREQQYVTYRF